MVTAAVKWKYGTIYSIVFCHMDDYVNAMVGCHCVK